MQKMKMANVKQHGSFNRKGTFFRLLKILFANYKWQMILVFVCIMITVVGNLSSSIFTKQITDVIEEDLKSGGQGERLINLFITLGGIYLVGALSSYLHSFTMAMTTQKYLNKLRIDLFDHMETLPIKYFDTHLHGDIMSIYTNDVDTIRILVSQAIPTIFQTSLTIVSLIVVMLSFSIWLSILVLAGTILMVMISRKLSGSMTKYFIRQQQALGQVEGNIQESINGLKVIKVFNHEEASIEKFAKINEELREVGFIANRNGNIIGPITGNIGNLLYVSLAALGCILYVMNSKDPQVGYNLTLTGFKVMTYGTVLSFLMMVRMFANNVNNLVTQLIHIIMGVAGAQRIFDLLDEESEDFEGRVNLVFAKLDEGGNVTKSEERTRLYAWEHHHLDGTVTYTLNKGDIVFKDVDFSYVEGKPVLKHINIYAEPGQKIALVGATGAGKTTITNLINRFYEINDGKIYYDGINITKINKNDLRKSLGVVLQDTNLFTGTVMENIRYGRLDATDEECINAAKIANAHDFITRLPNGYDTLLEGDGANLSQGQRQLLSIARAAVADAPVMVLDEATSSIDTRTEKLVTDGMDRLMENRTVFVIAHRLSTVRNSNAIMVIDNGEIIERGTHESLMAKHGRYYNLYTGAFELE